MIKSLSIKNYALIRELKMFPDSRLNIITGETGAGKSIILGAVGLMLGNRADTKMLFDENQKCVVEGVFHISNGQLKPLFEGEGIDFEKECFIRREISPTGKSRVFVNDTPINLGTLKSIGKHLIDIHSQHESLELGHNKYQLEVVDSFASHSELKNNYKELFLQYTKARNHLNRLEKTSTENAKNADYKQFLLKELLEAKLDCLDKETLQKELEVLENAENIKRILSQSTAMLDESEVAIIQQLSKVRSLLHSVSTLSKELSEASERMDGSSVELQDLTNELFSIQDKVEHDPEKIQQLKDRLDLLYRLEKKHNVLSVVELINIRDKLDKELQTTANLEEEIKKAREHVDKIQSLLYPSGTKLTESRKLSALNFADEIEKIIHKIGIENGTIEIKINPSEPTIQGLDTVEMLFSANKGIKPQELKEVASGGEFSRLIFAIKYLIADKTKLPSIIFDEIDTGVSGEVALQMIKMMKKMTQNHQIISISHLPQFAAGGDSHYFVYKDHSSERSVSCIKKLEQEERVIEIAKMIGGENPGLSAVESAKELLQI